jgi:nucleotide-binding universal stress UspA family protein
MSLESILVPVDGSSPSLAALEHALVLAEDSGASLDVLHVTVVDDFNYGETSSLTTEAREDNAAALDAAVELALERLGPRVERLEIPGDPERVIIETARAGNYDLIVIGTHGRIGRLHDLLGSVAEAVVRNAPCPVLTVREPGGGYQSFAEARHGRPSLGEQVLPR